MRIIEIDNGGIEIFRDNGETVTLDRAELFKLRTWFENDSLRALVSNTVQEEVNAEHVELDRYNMTLEEFCAEVMDDVTYRLDMYPDRVATPALVLDSIDEVIENHEGDFCDDCGDDRDDEYFNRDN